MADTRKYYPIKSLAGVVKDISPRMIPDSRISGCQNVIFEDGKVRRRYGYSTLGGNLPLNGAVREIIYYEQIRIGNKYTVVLTNYDAYLLNSSNGLYTFITRNYNTGTIASSSALAVTGTGSPAWLTTIGWNLSNSYKIKFGTNNVDTSTITMTGTWALSGTTITVASTANIVAGMPVSATGFAVGTRVVSITDATHFVISIAATALGSGATMTFTCEWFGVGNFVGATALNLTAIATMTGTTNGTTTVTVASTASLYAGMGVNGTGITANSYITSITDGTHFVLNATATAGSPTLTFGVYIKAASSVPYVVRFCFSGGSDCTFDYALPYTTTIDDKILVITNNADPIQKWTGTGGFQLLTTTGITPNYARCIGYFGASLAEHTVIGGMYDGAYLHPSQIYTSDAGNPESYMGAYYELLTSNDPITALKILGSYMVIYKSNSITMAYATPSGGNDDPLDMKQNLITNVGCPAPRTICDMGNYHLFLGNEQDSINIFAFNGQSVQPIAEEIINTIKSEISLPNIDQCFAFPIKKLNLYILFIATGTSEVPNKVYVYNFVEQHWTIWSFADAITAFGFARNEYNPTWADFRTLGTTWANTIQRWSDLRYYAQDKFPILGDADGYVYYFKEINDTDNGVEIDAFIETKDYALASLPSNGARIPDPRHTFKLLDSIIGYQGRTNNQTIQLSTSTDFGNTYPEIVNIDQSTSTYVANVSTFDYAETVCNFFQKGNYLRLKINNVSGSYFQIEGIVVGYTDEQGIQR